MSWRCPYDRCEGNGFVYDEEKNIATDCECRPQMIAQNRASRLRARIPRKYANVDFNTPPVTDMPPAVVRVVKRYVDQLNERLNEGRGLWFEGPQGTGKTTLAMLVSKHALAAGRSTAIYSVPRILSEMRGTFDDDAEFGSIELIDRLTEVELLQLDDLGAERTSPWVLEQLYSVINARYEAQRAVIVTTNLGREELIEQVGARTVSRLTEMCDVIPLYGEDRRLATSDLASPSSSPLGPQFGRPAQPAAPSLGRSAAQRGAASPSSSPAAPARRPPVNDDHATPSAPATWSSPAPAANLEPPSWSRSATGEDERVLCEDGNRYTVERPSWSDRSAPWPPSPPVGLQGSTRRGPSEL